MARHRVVFIEDYEDYRDLLVRRMEAEGLDKQWELLPFSSIEEAVPHMADCVAILTDSDLGETRGVETVTALAERTLDTIPLYVVTATHPGEHRDGLLKAGAWDIYVKVSTASATRMGIDSGAGLRSMFRRIHADIVREQTRKLSSEEKQRRVLQRSIAKLLEYLARLDANLANLGGQVQSVGDAVGGMQLRLHTLATQARGQDGDRSRALAMVLQTTEKLWLFFFADWRRVGLLIAGIVAVVLALLGTLSGDHLTEWLSIVRATGETDGG